MIEEKDHNDEKMATGSSNIVQHHVSVRLQEAYNLYDELKEVKESELNAMSIQCVTEILKKIRGCFDSLVELSENNQEKLAWIFLNCSKIMYDIAQPFVWLSCGKYMVESLFHALLCMDRVINLCTSKHLAFRMKLYTTVFYGSLFGIGQREAENVVNHLKSQLNDIRAKEELDLPIPYKVEYDIVRCEIDYSIMKLVLHFWKDPDSVDIENIQFLSQFIHGDSNRKTFLKVHESHHNQVTEIDSNPQLYSIWSDELKKKSFLSRFLNECFRLFQFESNQITNEASKNRIISIIKRLSHYFDKLSIDDIDYERPNQTSRIKFDGVNDNSSTNLSSSSSSKLSKLTIVTITEIFIFIQFISYDEVLNDKNKIMDKILTLIHHFQLSFDSDQYHDDIQHDSENRFHYKILTLLQSYTLLMNEMNNEFQYELILKLLASFCRDLNAFLIIDEIILKRRSLFQRLVIQVWLKILYPMISNMLISMNMDVKSIQFQQLTKSLLIVVNAINYSNLDDAIFKASVSLLTAHFLGKHSTNK
jgi:hypothetical protein